MYFSHNFYLGINRRFWETLCPSSILLPMATTGVIKKLAGDVRNPLNLLTFKVDDLDKYTHLSHFSNWLLYTPEMEACACLLMQTEYSIYYEKALLDIPDVPSGGKTVESKCSVFSTTILTTPTDDASKSKLDCYYYLHVYPCPDEDALAWWKAHADGFLVLSCMVRDVLAVPGASVPVEWLFSSSQWTITDVWCHMTAEGASMTICMKEWLKEGLGHSIKFIISRERCHDPTYSPPNYLVLGAQSLSSGFNPYASWTRTWPPNKVPLTCKPPGLRNTCLGHTRQLLINSGFIPKPSKHSTHQSLHLPSFLCNPDFPTLGVPGVLVTWDA